MSACGQLRGVIGEDHLRRPWNVAILPSGHVAVSDPPSGDVMTFTAEGQFLGAMRKTRRLAEPYGLAISNDGLLLVTDKWHKDIKMYDERTEKAEVIFRPEAPLHQWSLYLTTDVRNDVILTDYLTQSVLCVDKQGRVIWEHRQLMTSPEGVGTDFMGNILVCDTAADNVIALDKYGSHLRTVIGPESGLETPEALFMTPDDDIVVSECRTGDIKTFRLH